MGVCHNINLTVAREAEAVVSQTRSALLQALQKATGRAGAATRGGEAPRLPGTRRLQLLVTAVVQMLALLMGLLVLKRDGLLLVSTCFSFFLPWFSLARSFGFSVFVTFFIPQQVLTYTDFCRLHQYQLSVAYAPVCVRHILDTYCAHHAHASACGASTACLD